MNNRDLLFDYIKTAKNKLRLTLGDCVLDPIPLGEGTKGVVFKGLLNGEVVAVKCFLLNGEDTSAALNAFRKNYLIASLLEIRQNIVQYADYDMMRVGELDVPILIMKLYKNSLYDYRQILSVEVFLKLFRFLVNTTQFLHSMGITHGAINPNNILVNDHNEFVLTDVVARDTNSSVQSDIRAIGETLLWYAFGEVKVGAMISKVFPRLDLYDLVVARCLSENSKNRFTSVEELAAFVETQQERDPNELMRTFSLICRKNFPRELPDFVHCSDQRKVNKLFGDFIAKKDFFGSNVVYFSDVERNVFSPVLTTDGYLKLDNSTELKVLDVWIHSDNDQLNDYILIHHGNTVPQKVNGKEVYKWAVYEGQTAITWEEAMNGFAEIEGDIIPLDKTKIEYYNRIPREGYLFIALNHFHSLTNPANIGTLKDYFFRFSFSYVNRYILEDMNNQTRHHQSLPLR